MNKGSKPEVSVIILTWNSEKYIGNCINSVFIDAGFSGIKIEVIVVDNGSNDGTIEILEKLQKKYYKDLEVLKLRKNYGTTISRNMGIRKSAGKYIFILDSDTEVQPGTMAKLIKTIESEKNVGIAAPRLVYADGSIQPSCKKFPTAKIKFFKTLPFNKFHEIAKKEELYDPKVYLSDFDKIINVDYCISAAWMVNRKTIEDVGLFDENIFYAPEDVDYCLRTWLKGWKVVYDPKAKAIHYTQRLSHKNFKMALSQIKGLLYYFIKYRYIFNRERIYRKIRKVMEDE